MQALESLNEQQVREIYNFIFHPVMMSAQSPDSSVNRNLSHSILLLLVGCCSIQMQVIVGFC